MEKIDFENETPYFVNGNSKWYMLPKLNKYITTEQADNLPKLDNLYVFVVKNDEVNDIVLIDGNQNILRYKDNNLQGYHEMEVYINMLKIKQHFNLKEKSNSKRTYVK